MHCHLCLHCRFWLSQRLARGAERGEERRREREKDLLLWHSWRSFPCCMLATFYEHFLTIPTPDSQNWDVSLATQTERDRERERERETGRQRENKREGEGQSLESSIHCCSSCVHCFQSFDDKQSNYRSRYERIHKGKVSETKQQPYGRGTLCMREQYEMISVSQSVKLFAVAIRQHLSLFFSRWLKRKTPCPRKTVNIDNEHYQVYFNRSLSNGRVQGFISCMRSNFKGNSFLTA